jgi:hypothetical protein
MPTKLTLSEFRSFSWSILLILVKKFVNGIMQTAEERWVDGIAVLSAVIAPWLLGRGVWESVAYAIVVVCLILAVHMVRATLQVWLEIAKNARPKIVDSLLYAPNSEKLRTIVSEPIPHLFWVIPVTVCAISLFSLVAVSELSVRYLGPRVGGALKLSFKKSPELTNKRRRKITEDLNKFAEFLKSNGLELPSGTPMISVTGNSQLGYGTQAPYRDDIQIAAKDVDSGQAATVEYARWILSRLMPPKPEDPLNPNLNSFLYYQVLYASFSRYLSDSFWGKRSEVDDMSLSKALWAIRDHCQDADRFIVYTVRMFSEDYQEQPASPSDEYLLGEMAIADDRVNAKTASQMPCVREQLANFGIIASKKVKQPHP